MDRVGRAGVLGEEEMGAKRSIRQPRVNFVPPKALMALIVRIRPRLSREKKEYEHKMATYCFECGVEVPEDRKVMLKGKVFCSPTHAKTRRKVAAPPQIKPAAPASAPPSTPTQAPAEQPSTLGQATGTPAAVPAKSAQS